jgi:hypothetical protein
LSKIRDLTGQRFGQLVVLERAFSPQFQRTYWSCRCDCGSVHPVSGLSLTQGSQTSCRCSWRSSGAASKTWRGHGEISGGRWSSVLSNAAQRGIAVEINIQDAWELFLQQDRRCALSGVLLAFSRTGRERTAQCTASLDRIDSDIGYRLNNVQWIHKVVQGMKWDFSTQEFITWCRLVANNQ